MSIGSTLRRCVGVAACLGLALAAAGCSGPSPDYAEEPAETAVASAYQIGPGDTLQVFVWRSPELSVTVPVRPDGRISTPLIEDMAATGKTPSQLGRDIEKELTRYVQEPVVTVIATNFVGPYSQQVRVIGEATRPQAIAYRHNMSVLDVMIAVGGVTPFAAGNRASIVRKVDGKDTQLPVDLDRLMKDGNIAANRSILPGDVLVIPQSWF